MCSTSGWSLCASVGKAVVLPVFNAVRDTGGGGDTKYPMHVGGSLGLFLWVRTFQGHGETLPCLLWRRGSVEPETFSLSVIPLSVTES